MATYYFRNVGTNWGDAANWSLTDGGGATGAVPTSTDDAKFTLLSGSVVVNTSARVCKTLDFTGYIGVITMTNGITISGNLTLSATMTILGASNLIINSTSTITTNTKVWPNSITIDGTFTFTLADDLNTGTFIIGITGNKVLNGFKVYCSNLLNAVGTQAITTGTTDIVINTSTTGTWDGGGAIQLNIEIKPTGVLTVGSLVCFGGGGKTLKYTSSGGSVVTTGSTLNTNIGGASVTATFDTVGIVWDIVASGSAGTKTVSSSFDMNTYQGNNFSAVFNGSTLNTKNILLTTGNLNGTTNIILNGTGTWSSTGGAVRNNLEINHAGTTTVSGSVTYSDRTLKRTAGTVVTTSSTLNVGTLGACTLDTNGITWNNVVILGGVSTTLTSLLTASSITLGASGTVTFAGAAGFTTGTLSCTTAGRTVTLVSTNTYTVTGALILTGSTASRITLNASTATSRAILNLSGAGVTQTVNNVNSTDMDSSGGQTIYATNSTLLRTINWNISSGLIYFFLEQKS